MQGTYKNKIKQNKIPTFSISGFKGKWRKKQLFMERFVKTDNLPTG